MRECVAALVVEREKILLGKRSPGRDFYPGLWDVFGGHLARHESREQALLRELDEELGITPTEWAYIGTWLEPHPERHGTGQYAFYVVTAWGGTPSNLAPHEHEHIEWFSLEEAMQLELAHPAYVDLFARLLGDTAGSERLDDSGGGWKLSPHP